MDHIRNRFSRLFFLASRLASIGSEEIGSWDVPVLRHTIVLLCFLACFLEKHGSKPPASPSPGVLDPSGRGGDVAGDEHPPMAASS